jgi:hypothetical protein
MTVLHRHRGPRGGSRQRTGSLLPSIAGLGVLSFEEQRRLAEKHHSPERWGPANKPQLVAIQDARDGRYRVS